MSYFYSQLNRLKNPVEKLEFFRKEDTRIQTIVSNLTAMNDMITQRYSVYDKKTKSDINFLADRYKAIFRDYRSAMIKDSKKVDLPKTLIEVNNRTMKDAQRFYIESNLILDEIKKEMDKYAKRQYGEKLLAKIYPQKDEYIRSFEKISEGVRAWDCLVDLVEDGTITLEGLQEYGIEIEGIVID